MPVDLDAEWVRDHPPVSPDRLRFTFLGAELMRLEEVPLESFRLIEENPNDFLPMIAAVRAAINPAYHEAFDRLVPPPGETGREYVTPARVTQLFRWLVREGSGRPTQPPSDSSDGASTHATGTPSTGGTSTAEEWGSEGSEVASSPTSPTSTSAPAPSTDDSMRPVAPPVTAS